MSCVYHNSYVKKGCNKVAFVHLCRLCTRAGTINYGELIIHKGVAQWKWKSLWHGVARSLMHRTYISVSFEYVNPMNFTVRVTMVFVHDHLSNQMYCIFRFTLFSHKSKNYYVSYFASNIWHGSSVLFWLNFKMRQEIGNRQLSVLLWLRHIYVVK